MTLPPALVALLADLGIALSHAEAKIQSIAEKAGVALPDAVALFFADLQAKINDPATVTAVLNELKALGAGEPHGYDPQAGSGA